MDSNSEKTEPPAPSGSSEEAAGPSKRPGGFRAWIDYGPLAVFFIVNLVTKDPFQATGGLMIAVLIALLASWKIERRIPKMTLYTAIGVGIFGGLTLWLKDETFIQMKLTIVNVLMGLGLLGGVLAGKSPLKSLLGDSLPLSDPAWRKLTVRYALFFLATAGINEIVRRQVTWETYVNFKVFGMILLTIGFTATQLPFLSRELHEVEEG